MSAKHIVGHDGTSRGDDALALARKLAPEREGDRIVAHVIVSPALDLMPDDEYFAELRAAAEEGLAGVRAALAPGEELRIVEAPSVAHGLHELAESEPAGLVVVGSSHRGTTGRALLGTTADRLLHGSPCPVVAAAEGFGRDPVSIRRVLLAYDGGSEARAAVAVAAEVARIAPGKVDVITVRQAIPAVGHPGAAGFAAYAVQSAERTAAEAAQRAVDALPSDLAGSPLTSEPPAGRAIAQTAEERSADLIVMGSRAYGPVRRVLLGSTGRAVLHDAACSVLVVPRASPAG